MSSEANLPASTPSPADRWSAFAVVAFATLMSTLDASIFFVAQPALAAAFQVSASLTQWVLTGYLMAQASLLINFGRLGDSFGRSRVLLLGLAVFTAASAGCAFAPSIEALIALRVLQGIGAAMMTANGTAIVLALFPPEKRGLALGLTAIPMAAGLMLGPALGGLILESLPWTAIFLMNLPLGALAFVLGLRYLPGRAPSQGQGRPDLLGAALGAASIASLLYFLSSLERADRATSIDGLAVAVMLVLFGLLIGYELRASTPMLPRDVLRLPAVRVGLSAFGCNQIGLAALTNLLPFLLVRVGGYSFRRMGMVMSILPLVILLFSAAAGRRSDHSGTRYPAALGMALMAAALLGLPLVAVPVRLETLVPVIAVFAVGATLFQPANNSAIMGAVPEVRFGVTTGLLGTVRSLGTAVGTALVWGLFLRSYRASGSAFPVSGPVDIEAFAAGFQLTCWAVSIVVAAGAVLVLLSPPTKPVLTLKESAHDE